MSNVKLWQPNKGKNIPATANTAVAILAYSNYFNDKNKSHIIQAFKTGAYEMAVEYVWKKAMTKLKETISSLGPEFIGEMLGRNDIDENTPIDLILTEHTSIVLAEQLGVINSTAALKLKQYNELIGHYFSEKAIQEEEELDSPTAVSILKTAIDYILYENNTIVAVHFSKFRDRLLSETLNKDDETLQNIVTASLFYLRTVLKVLTNSLKKDSGATLENALANLNLILPQIWDNISESDKWNIGTTYTELVAAGNSTSVSGLKKALLKVRGFDYVPENLRTVTYKNAAAQAIEAHFSFNNFYNEVPAIDRLSKLGSVIPASALAECMQAYLAVFLGNNYGTSREAAPIAERELSRISKDRWERYFDKIVISDEVILSKLHNKEKITKLSNFIKEHNLADFKLAKESRELYKAILEDSYTKTKATASKLLKSIKE